MSKLLLAGLSATTSIGLASTASADLLAYEGFDYNNGPVASNGSAADAGWAGGWVQGTNGATVVAGGLSYAGLLTSGGAIDLSGAGTTTSFRQLDSIINDPGDTSTGEVWFSYLIQPGAYTANPFAGLSFYTDAVTATGAADPDLAMATRNSGGTQVYGFSDLDIVSNFLLTSVAAVEGETSLLVGRIVLGGGTNTSANNEDRIYLYFNPTSLGGANPDLGDALADANVTANFQSIRFAAQDGQPFIVDEFRIGETYADVTPIPEPGSLALLGLGGLMIARRRRGQ